MTDLNIAEPQQVKKPWFSKTNIAQVLMSILWLTFPAVARGLETSPEVAAQVMGLFFAGINIVLRFMTKAKIELH